MNRKEFIQRYILAMIAHFGKEGDFTEEFRDADVLYDQINTTYRKFQSTGEIE